MITWGSTVVAVLLLPALAHAQETFPPESEPVTETLPSRGDRRVQRLFDAAAPVMDVMVLWTPQAEAGARGEAGIRKLIVDAVALTNQVYVNSQVDTSIRLVHAQRWEYRETTISADLAALRTSPEVRVLRDRYGADMVALIGETYRSAGSCGQAGMMRAPDVAYEVLAFSITARTCAVGNLSFPHELGHNQGLTHDPANVQNLPSYTFAYGHEDPDKAFRTVMSYGSAPRRPILSNPLVPYNGKPTGFIGTKDNALALKLNAPIVASFRPTSVPLLSAPSGLRVSP